MWHATRPKDGIKRAAQGRQIRLSGCRSAPSADQDAADLATARGVESILGDVTFQEPDGYLSSMVDIPIGCKKAT